MSDYPKDRPTTLDDVRRGHIVGKVTNVNQHNSLWLRDALDVALADVSRLEEALKEIIKESRVPAHVQDVKYFLAAFCYHRMKRIAQEALLPKRGN